MTVAELDRWALQHNWGAHRRGRLDRYLDQFAIYPFDRDLCRAWARVADNARRRGRPIQTADAWIAATALLHDLPLVTHNPADYLGVTRLNLVSEAPFR